MNFFRSVNFFFERVILRNTACWQSEKNGNKQLTIVKHILTNISKAFDYLPLEVLIAELNAHGFHE